MSPGELLVDATGGGLFLGGVLALFRVLPRLLGKG